MAKKIGIFEFFKTDSKFSIMRKGFWVVLINGLAMIWFIIASYVIGQFASMIINGTAFTLDLIGLSTIVSPLVLFAFVGKSSQSFAEVKVPTQKELTQEVENEVSSAEGNLGK